VKDWKVVAIQVQLEKHVAKEHQLNHRLRKTRVSINVRHLQSIGDRVILKESKDDLLKLIASSEAAEPKEEEEKKKVMPESPGVPTTSVDLK